MNNGTIEAIINEKILECPNDLLTLYKGSVISIEQLYAYIGYFEGITKL